MCLCINQLGRRDWLFLPHFFLSAVWQDEETQRSLNMRSCQTNRHQSCAGRWAEGGNQLLQSSALLFRSLLLLCVALWQPCASAWWVTKRQLCPRRPRGLRPACRMLHWSGSKPWFLPLRLSGRPRSPRQRSSSLRVFIQALRPQWTL